MAFSSTTFATIGASKKGNAPSIYSYATTDAIADINTEGYFNSLSDTLAIGDLIYIVSSTGGTRVSTLAQVLSNTGGVVDIADGTTLAATDGD
tara:strand:+ start:161 stop:439 length:279 start_codon:yes stop_codon:yes gene_type:complete